MKNFRGKWFLGVLIFLAIFALAAAVVMLLWNWLVPAIIGWGVIGYLQAAGLLLLCKLLFGGFRGHGMRGMHGCRGGHGHHPHFTAEDKKRIHEKMKSMSRDERREYVRNHMFGGPGVCGPWDREGTQPDAMGKGPWDRDNTAPDRENEGK